MFPALKEGCPGEDWVRQSATGLFVLNVPMENRREDHSESESDRERLEMIFD